MSHRVVKICDEESKLVCPTDHTSETSSVIMPSGLLFMKITRGKCFSVLFTISYY